MRESDLRKWHRRMGIALGLSIILQAGSGLLISLGEFQARHSHAHGEAVVEEIRHHDDERSLWHESVEFIHHGGGALGAVYRLLLGTGMVGMVVSGSMIFFKVRARTRKS